MCVRGWALLRAVQGLGRRRRIYVLKEGSAPRHCRARARAGDCSFFAGCRLPHVPVAVLCAVGRPSVGAAGHGVREPRVRVWAWRNRGVLALRASDTSEMATMLRVPWGGGQPLGGGAATTPEEKVQGVDTATILRVPWRGKNVGSAGDEGRDAAEATELQIGGDSVAAEAGGDAAEAEGKTRSPNKLQQLLA